MDGQARDGSWVDIGAAAELRESGRKLVKIDGRQIAVFHGADGIHACNNRCPHEGYPLIEGSLTGDCILTCNWHNWKFDLASGETLVGGDRLRRYPTRIADGRIYVDLAEPAPETVIAAALDDLMAALEDDDYPRTAREVARIRGAGGAPVAAVVRAVRDNHDRFEYGMTHAIAAGADWLHLHERLADDPVKSLAAVTEAVAHVGWDALRRPRFPYPEGREAFDRAWFVQAIEDEDEATAIRMLRGALADGMGFDDLYPALTEAALAHYQDFGHSLIYTVKAREFVARAGAETLAPVLLMLVRSLIYATREDLIPEFAAYGPALAAWAPTPGAPDPAVLRRGGLKRVLAEIPKGAQDPLAVYDALMATACWQMRHMDLSYSMRTEGPVQDNVGWLDFTHAITFGNAVRHACARVPALWPQGLLQIGCFLGRNAKYVDADADQSGWRVDDPAAFARDAMTGALDHGQAEYIVAAHIVKLSTAVHDELASRPAIPWAGDAAAALNRFLNSPLRRKNPLRTAAQAIDIVQREDG